MHGEDERFQLSKLPYPTADACTRLHACMQARMGTLMRRRMGASIGTSLRCSIRSTVRSSVRIGLHQPSSALHHHPTA